MVTIDGRDHFLGAYNTLDSLQAYQRLITKWHEARLHEKGPPSPSLAIVELVERFMQRARLHYRHADGTQTSEIRDHALSFRPLIRIYGGLQTRDFDSVKLAEVRESMILGATEMPSGKKHRACCRRVANQRIGRIQRLFKWAATQLLVPTAVYQNLLTLEGLEQHRSEARETEPVLPVPAADVEATLPFLAPYLAGDPEQRIFPYRVDSYDRAIARAAKEAHVPHWHPNELRHCRASEVAALKDIETASQVLGNPSAIRVYVEPDLAKAEEVIRQTG